MGASLQDVIVPVLVLLAIVAAVWKGSRAPQAATASGAAPGKDRSPWLASIPVLCAAISFAALLLLGSVDDHTGFHVPPWPVRALLGLLGFSIIVPWFVGAYFAFLLARGQNLALRVVGALEFIGCLIFGCFYAFAMLVGTA